ncbi:DUF6350 family protein [Rhodoluna limnophila]|uniref:cell division protein PerM n=1 Tax=Rhodoluna limnophila TaxID=232537 RepID=UPI0011069F10|nr:DUF6350 family protein [Rhodoluna limnophila]
MNRKLTFLIAALEAAIVAAIGVGITLAPLTVVWLFENDPSIDWLVPYRTAADIWLMAHGTRLMVSEGVLGSVAVPEFVISMLPLGMTFVVGYMAFKLGRRLTSASELWPGWIAATASYGGISFLLSTTAHNDAIYPVTWQGTFFPPAFLFFFVLIGSLFGKREAIGDAMGIPEPTERIWVRAYLLRQFNSMHWAIRAMLSPAFRAGTGVVAITLGVSSVLIAVLIALNWIQFTRLYEGLHVSILGGIILTLGQIAILPNVIVYGASWLTGVGFAIGEGSMISPLGTVVGPLPALPITAALPIGQAEFGLIAVLVPMLAAFITTLLIRRHAADIRFEFASAWSAAISLGLAIGVIAAVELGILAALASGSVGPGRLATVGINPWMLMVVVFIEVASVAILAAFFSARPDKPDHPLLSRKHKVN